MNILRKVVSTQCSGQLDGDCEHYKNRTALKVGSLHCPLCGSKVRLVRVINKPVVAAIGGVALLALASIGFWSYREAKSVASRYVQTAIQTDNTIRHGVALLLEENPQLRARQIQVQAKNGVVTLVGTVNSEAERLAADKIVREAANVRGLVDKLTVETASAGAQAVVPNLPRNEESTGRPLTQRGIKEDHQPERTDSQIEDEVEAALFRDPVLKEQAIKPGTTNGIVTLTGTVESENQSLAAENLVNRVQGVKGVDNKLSYSAATAAVAPRPRTAPSPATPPPHPVPVSKSEVSSVSIPSGTVIGVTTIDPIDSEKNHTGDVFRASLAAPVIVNDRVLLPRDSDVYLRALEIRSAGHFKGISEVRLVLDHVVYSGHSYTLDSSSFDVDSSSRGKQTAERVGGGAAIGAIIGGITGGGKGAAIGAGAGAGAGTLAQIITKGKQIVIQPETAINFQLLSPVAITVAQRNGK